MKKLFFFALAAAFCLVSCEKDPLADENSNWWYRSQLGPKGVKSITDEYGNVTNFNQNGTIASEKGDNYQASYKYSKDGTLTESTTVETYDKKTITTTYKFEYNNKGKFIPRPMNRDSSSTCLSLVLSRTFRRLSSTVATMVSVL